MDPVSRAARIAGQTLMIAGVTLASTVLMGLGASVNAQCNPTPCVRVTAQGPAAACPGQPVSITCTVTNCSDASEFVIVVLNGWEVFEDTIDPGPGRTFTVTPTMPACEEGVANPRATYVFVANASDPCAMPIEDTFTLEVSCVSAPCVSATAQCGPPTACPGAPITVTGSGTNCGASAEDVTVTIDGQSQTFPAVASGATVSWSRTIPMRDCTSGAQVAFNVTASASNPCGVATPSNASCAVSCQLPQVGVVKAVSPAGAVNPGTTLGYTITVSNPSSSVALENVSVSDAMCADVTYAGNASPAPSSAPAAGTSGTVTWNLASVPAGSSVVFSYNGVVRTLDSPACEAPGRSCTNTVTVVGNCAGAQARAQSSVTTPINACAPRAGCGVSGEGSMTTGGSQQGNNQGEHCDHQQVVFGGNVGPAGSGWQHLERDGRTILLSWYSKDAHISSCSGVPPGQCPKASNMRADFVGTGQYTIGRGGSEKPGNMVAYVIDRRDASCNTGRRDGYSIVVRKGLVVGQGQVVFSCSGDISSGDLLVQGTSSHMLSNGVATTEQLEPVGAALVNRPYPNPFSGTTTFAFKVADGAAVEVGVYNVAGRLVKTLASGSRSAGTYTVTWNGSDEAGMRMAPGVFFLKSRVGTESSVTRLIYVAR